MKKLFTIALLAFATAGFAQNETFMKGDNVINLGIGFGSGLYGGTGYSTTLPPLSISYERGVIDDFLTEGGTLGIGGYIGYAGSKYEVAYFGGTYGWKYNYLVAGIRGNYHYSFVENLDTYGGLMLAFTNVSSEQIGSTIPGGNAAATSGIGLSGYIGARYYFTENFAAMAELGFGVAIFNVGVALAF